MSLNVADKGTRRIIAVQLPENLDLKLENTPKTEKTKVQKVLDFLDSVHRPHALDQVGLERISRAVKHIREQYPDTTADLGFRHFTLKEPTSMSVEKMEKFSPDENGLVITNTVLEEFGIPMMLLHMIHRWRRIISRQILKKSLCTAKSHVAASQYRQSQVACIAPTLCMW